MTHFFRQQNPVQRNWPVVMALVLGTSVIIWRGSVVAAPQTSPQVQARSKQYTPLAQINLQKQFVGQQVRVLGFSEQNQLLLTRWKPNSGDTGHITKWDLQKDKIIRETPLSKWLSESDLTGTLDGRWLATINVRENLAFPHVKAYRVTVLRTSELKAAMEKAVPHNEDIVGILSSGDSQHIITKTFTTIPIGSDVTFGNVRLDWLNTATGKVDKTLSYQPARECDKLIASPGKKYLLGLFYSEAFNPDGESDYTPLRNQLEKAGFLDVLDSKTGKILWHLEGSAKQPVGDPLFFISPTQFVSSDTLFDIPSKTAKPWKAVSASRQCLAAVPSHATYALFWTKTGIELRNWRANLTLRRWPTLKQKGRVLFSPDLKVFSFQNDSTIQFWKFDSKWLS